MAYNRKESHAGRIVALSILGGVAAIIGMMFGIPTYNRYQDVLDARNRIVVNELVSEQTEQLVGVEKQKAQIRIQEAEGIAAAQRIINATLTDRYLQHEAIRAQEKMAGSPNHTQIYIPVGTNGIPLVVTANPRETPAVSQ